MVSVYVIMLLRMMTGTPDAGRHIYAENIKFNKRMKFTAEKLNLKSHMCGLDKDNSKMLYSCAGDDDLTLPSYIILDLEGHSGLDGRFYLLVYSFIDVSSLTFARISLGHS